MTPDKETFKAFALLIPDKWESLHAGEKARVLKTVLDSKDEILSACPGVKAQFDRAFGAARSRRGEGMALEEIRGALWSAYYGNVNRCSGDDT